MFRAALAALFVLALVGCHNPGRPQFTVFFTNDLGTHLESDRNGRGGLARIAYLVKQAKAENPHTILLDAGDMAVGTAFGTETRGESVFRVMNAAGYDAATFGNHEFDLGAEQAKRYQEIAKFPLIACNIRDRESKPFAQEYAIFQIGEVRVGVIGVANPKTPGLVEPSAVSELKFLPAEGEVRRVQNDLAGQADLFIVLSHQGLKQDLYFAYHVTGVSLIIGGHSEVKLGNLIEANGTGIAQAGNDGWWLGRADFYLDPKTKAVKGLKYRLIKISDGLPEDPATRQAVEAEKKLLPAGIGRVIGKSRRGLSKDYVGFWAAELLKDFGKAELGVINTGGVRSEIYRGEITPADIYEILPFNDRVAVFEIDGAELLRSKRLGYFYFSRGPKITAGRTYRVSSIDYLVKIADFPGARNVQIFDSPLRQVMIERIEKDRGLSRFWEK